MPTPVRPSHPAWSVPEQSLQAQPARWSPVLQLAWQLAPSTASLRQGPARRSVHQVSLQAYWLSGSLPAWLPQERPRVQLQVLRPMLLAIWLRPGQQALSRVQVPLPVCWSPVLPQALLPVCSSLELEQGQAPLSSVLQAWPWRTLPRRRSQRLPVRPRACPVLLPAQLA